MNDVTILDLFWLILKFLAALGLIGLIGLALYLLWGGAKRATKTSVDVLRGHNTSVAAIVCFVLAVVAVVSSIVILAAYLHYHPSFW